jgi:hypothetical protein
VEYDSIGIEIGLVFEYSSSLLGESHQIPDIGIGSDHLNFGYRLFDMDIGTWFGDIFRIGDIEIGTLSSLVFEELSSCSRIECYLVSSDQELVGDLWTRDDDIHSILSPESFLDDIEMEEPEESTTESVSQSG